MAGLVDYGDSDEDVKELQQPSALEDVGVHDDVATVVQSDTLPDGLLAPPSQWTGRQTPITPCLNPEELEPVQQKVTIQRLLKMRHRGLSIHDYVTRSPQFQNPYCLERIMEVFDIIPYCSNFSPILFDPEALNTWEAPRFRRLAQEKLHAFAEVANTPIPALSPAVKRQRQNDGGGVSLGAYKTTRTTEPADTQCPVRKTNKWDVRGDL